ncbi:peptidoglycan/LPS O-acetylase OafA/YrhL [Nocardiopsis sp. Huas11]|uniref:acyltransferase family protein n=1 Tax=Nocardiopsis sp. Huas11 TaxID=2183912 RepID=UPI000EB4E5A9|nr:acyltransferase family protein [Nocardiopsis sp. Huas11]RKS10287.1 peptidoglycan/LPS O-acetylase OafA/YrhL [Nocardiopsis sp. Huas11]
MHAAPATAERRFRPEVQGLRAVAVLIVLVYHLDPALLPGGYVGVDVFFVISGFLITSLLHREVTAHGRVSISGFYVRRVRRLLPASTVVLVATGVAAFVILPGSRLTDTAWQLVSSAAYVENLYLARQAVDYLAAEVPPSPVQHFWSLSVEEQFYVVWPLLFVVWALTWRWRRSTWVLTAILGTVFVASLVCSVVLTGGGDAGAYFLPTTRAWELAAGGLLAVAMSRGDLPELLRRPLGYAGPVAILAAAVLYDDGTAFPGWAALLPVLGAVAVIAAGPVPASAPLRSAPARWLGDVSYSLYLWHWPVIILLLALTGQEGLGVVGIVAAATVSLLLAWATKVWVEDPVRDRRLVPNVRHAAVVVAASVLAAATVSGATLVRVEREAAVSFDPAVHTGPAALDLASAPEPAPLYPPPVTAEEDIPVLYDDECHASHDDSDPSDPCVYGPEDAERTVALLGDSHSAQWFPALERLANERGWRVAVFTKSSCAFTDTLIRRPDGGAYTECREWNRAVVDELGELRPDLVVTSSSVMNGPVENASAVEDEQVIADGMSMLWTDVLKVSGRLVAVRDTPRTRTDVTECLETHGDDPSACELPEDEAFTREDPQELAAADVGEGAALVDLSDRFCVDGTCPAAIGNVVVYRDSHHITGTYVEMLTDDLAEQMDAALA